MTWLNVREAKTLLGYQDGSSVSRFARKHSVRTKPIPRGTGKSQLYNKNDIIAALTSGNHHDRYSPHHHWDDDWLAKYNTDFKLDGDWVVIADAHCPFVDWDFWETSLRIRDKNKGPRKLILAGDILDCCSLSKFHKLISVPWDKEKVSARIFVRKALQEYDEVVVITGNHEMRYLLKLWAPQGCDILTDAGQSDLWSAALKQLTEETRLRISIYGHCTINDSWRVTHPKTARKNPLSLTRELSNIHNQSIVLAHAHMTAYSPAPDGKRHLIDCGCFFDPYYADYKNLVDTAHYKWSESFVIIENNFGRIYLKGRNYPVISEG